MTTADLDVRGTANDADIQLIHELPILVILPHSRCNCRCVMCDIWRIRQVREITAADLEPHRASLRKLKVRWVVLSGGEPLMHSDLPGLTQMLRADGIRTTLLTAGLILEQHAGEVARDFDDVIVSLDGPAAIHDRIRGVPNAYRRLARGIKAVRERRAAMPVHARCTVQKQNFEHLCATVAAAKELALDSISFLAADTATDAFNHHPTPPISAVPGVALDAPEVDRLRAEIDRLAREYSAGIESGFIREKPAKLRRIADRFDAQLGKAQAVAPRCNAPWVSAVIEADGAVRPCFFHAPVGNLCSANLEDVINGPAALRFRGELDIASNPICQNCVCSLFLHEGRVEGAAAI